MIIKPGLSQSDEFHPAGVTNGAAWYSLKVGFKTEAKFLDNQFSRYILNP